MGQPEKRSDLYTNQNLYLKSEDSERLSDLRNKLKHLPEKEAEELNINADALSTA